MKSSIMVLLMFYCHSILFAGVIAPRSKWDKKEVRVCWLRYGTQWNDCAQGETQYKRDFSSYLLNLKKYKKIIQQVVQDQYTVDKTGISFVGWEKCPKINPGSSYDALLRIETYFNAYKGFGGGAVVGQACKSQKNKVPSIGFSLSTGRWEKNLDFRDQVRLNALHEFGHLAGLMHEDDIFYALDRIESVKGKIVDGHNSYSVMSYQFLNLLRLNGTEINIEDIHDNQLFKGEITNSPPSVLVVPVENKLVVKPILSSGDIKALRCLYKESDNCNAL